MQTLVTQPDMKPATPGPAAGRLVARAVNASDLWIAFGLAASSMVVTFDAWTSILTLGTFKEELSYVLLAPVLIAWTAWSVRARKALMACASCSGG